MSLSVDVKARLSALHVAVEELHARVEDGYNDFRRDEPVVRRLLNALDAALNADTHEAGGCCAFLRTALDTLKPAPATHGPWEQATSRHFSDVEMFRYWVVASLSLEGSLHAALRAVFPMRDILRGFYTDDAAAFLPGFVEAFLRLVALLNAHPSLGAIRFDLDPTAMSLFDDEAAIQVVRRKPRTLAQAAGTKPSKTKRRPPTGSAATPQPQAETAEIAVQTEWDDAAADDTAAASHLSTPPPQHIDPLTPVPTPRPHRGRSAAPPADVADAGAQTEQPAPAMTFADLCDLERSVDERDRMNKAAIERIRQRELEVEERMDEANDHVEGLTRLLGSLKTLYNEHFLLVKEAQDADAPINFGLCDPLLAQLSALVSGNASVVMGGPPGSTTASAAGPRPMLLANVASGSMVFDAPLSSAASAVPSSPHMERAPSFSVVSVPDTPPSKVLGDRPWILHDTPEKERLMQLTSQGYKCPDCCAALPQNSATNFLTKAVQGAGQLARKPRRCHYCGEHYCHNCHSNKASVLPHRVLHHADAAEYHVCNRDYHFLVQNFERPLLYLPSLPPDLRHRGAVAAAAALRQQLVRMYAVLFHCPDAKAALGPVLSGGHYFSREHYYSLSDLVSLVSADTAATGMKAVSSALARSASATTFDLLAVLQGLATRGRDHILDQCAQCRGRALAACALCHSDVILFEDGDACADCGKLSHATCLEIMACPCKGEQ
jgi:hypothetical protein